MKLKPIIPLLLWLGCSPLTQANESPLLQPDYPATYVVQQGDTLWDIAAHYLQKPWQWPILWQSNPQIANPHRIYPGDQLALQWQNGVPRLVRSGAFAKPVITLTPKVRREAANDAIPALPLAAIEPFLTQDLLFASQAQRDGAPMVLGNNSGQRALLAPAILYVRGVLQTGQRYGVYRAGSEFHDPHSGEWLGQVANLTGVVRADSVAGEGMSRVTLLSNREEVREGDRLLPLPADAALQAQFEPRPAAPLQGGEIIGLPGQRVTGSRLDVVLINRGAREALTPGMLLHAWRPGALLTHATVERFAEAKAAPAKNPRLPAEVIATIMLFKVYPTLSYGLIMHSQDLVRVGYAVTAP